jgi:hypothetical protein
MTEKTKELMKEIMKEILRTQSGDFSPEQNGCFQYTDNCIAAEICPDCGSEIFVNVGAIDKERARITTFFECSACEWKNYDYAEHRL